MREVAAEFRNPVMLYSIGKDSSVMLHLARKAFFPGKPPFPLLHIDTGWKFREMIAFRDETARAARSRPPRPHQRGGQGARHQSDHLGLGIAYRGHEDRGTEAGARHATVSMRRSAGRGATRRKAAPRNASFRCAAPSTRWDPKNQRPELWRLYNTRLRQGETMRVFPLSNWTELDVWEYIAAEKIPVVPLYFAKPRPVVSRNGVLIMVDDDRLPLEPGEHPEMRLRPFPHLGLLSADRGNRSRRRRRSPTSSRNCANRAGRSGKGG